MAGQRALYSTAAPSVTKVSDRETLRECQKRNEKHKRKKKKRDKKLESMEGIVLAKRGLGKKRIVTWRRDTKKFGTGEEQGWAYWVLSQEGGVL